MLKCKRHGNSTVLIETSELQDLPGKICIMLIMSNFQESSHDGILICQIKVSIFLKGNRWTGNRWHGMSKKCRTFQKIESENGQNCV